MGGVGNGGIFAGSVVGVLAVLVLVVLVLVVVVVAVSVVVASSVVVAAVGCQQVCQKYQVKSIPGINSNLLEMGNDRLTTWKETNVRVLALVTRCVWPVLAVGRELLLAELSGLPDTQQSPRAIRYQPSHKKVIPTRKLAYW